MTRSNSAIHSIYRYPVKGLSPDKLTQTSLTVGETIVADRIYAIENGPSGFDSAMPAHVPKARFLTLMRNARLAAFRTSFDEASHVLTVHLKDKEVLRANLKTAEGRTALEELITTYFADDLCGPARILTALGHSFSDMPRKLISVINLASVAAIEKALGAAVNPLRFRGNLYVAGWPAWQEFELIGREIGIGSSARVKIVERIKRCAATDVNPDSGIRDLNIPKTLMHAFGNIDCGVYATVVKGGEIMIGDLMKTPP